MFIKKISIKNFRTFKNIEIDFSANKNKIEKDLAVGRFTLVNKKVPLSTVTSIVGRNSVGKTTLIRSLSFLRDIETSTITNGIVNSIVKKNWLKYNKKSTANGQSLLFSNSNEEIIQFQQKREDLASTIRKSIRNKKEIHFKDYIFSVSKWFSDFFKDNAHDVKEKSFKFNIQFIEENGKITNYELIVNEDGNILRNIIGDISSQQIITYFRGCIAPSRMHTFGEDNILIPGLNKWESTSYFHHKDIERALSSLIKNIGIDKTKKLINLADEDVKGIKYTQQNNTNIIIENIILPTSKIQPRHLSSGTKQFVVIAEAIIRVYKRNGNFGLILIDKIEKNIHNELIVALLNLLISAFKVKKIQSIVTTHNLYVLPRILSNKQIISIQKSDGEHIVKRASSIMKPHESIGNKYESGFIAEYPDVELIRNTMADIINEL